MIAEQDRVAEWIRLIQAEYLEIPGLHLTRAQVERLWSLEPHVCDALLDALVSARFLRRTPREMYVLASASH